MNALQCFTLNIIYYFLLRRDCVGLLLLPLLFGNYRRAANGTGSPTRAAAKVAALDAIFINVNNNVEWTKKRRMLESPLGH